MLKITCYGAVGEIGGNKILLEDSGSSLMLDFGKSFGAMGRFFDEFLQPRTNSSLRDLLSLGILPAIPGIYRKDLLTHGGAWSMLCDNGIPERARGLFERDLESCEDYAAKYGCPRLDGILLSHGHTDHCQHLCFVDPRIPVYCSSVTAAILKAAQDMGRGGWESEICECSQRAAGECGKTSTFPGAPKIGSDGDRARDIRTVGPHEVFSVGGFSVEMVPVDHSVPGACAYIITAPSGKTVFYTGDVRFHGRFSLGPDCVTSRLSERTRGLRPDVMITEGTRLAGKDGKVTTSGDNEQDVEDSIKEVVGGCQGLAIVDFGWKDTTRFQTILNVAKATGRVLAASPKVAYLWELLRGDGGGYPDLSQSESVRIYLKRTESMLYSLADYSGSKHLAGPCTDWGDRSADMKKAVADDNTAYTAPRLRHIRDGVRGYDIADNPRGYILHAGYYDINELFDVAPPRGSVYVSAVTEPFSDEMAFGEERLANWLREFGLIDTSETVEHYHVSGHANGSDLLQFIRDAQPSMVVPIHCEERNLPIFGRELGTRCDVVLPELEKTIEVG